MVSEGLEGGRLCATHVLHMQAEVRLGALVTAKEQDVLVRAFEVCEDGKLPGQIQKMLSELRSTKPPGAGLIVMGYWGRAVRLRIRCKCC